MIGLAELLRGSGNVVFPPVCVHCRNLVGEDSCYPHLCARCARGVRPVRRPHCTTCGHPFFGEVEAERICPHCLGLDPAFGRGCTAVLLRGAPRALVIELKYHRGLQVLEDMERIFRKTPEVLAHVRHAVLVPVPLHSRKERERGYNQSRLLAELLARLAGGSTRVAEVLRRTVDTPTQTVRDRRSRRTNLKNAFALAAGGTLNPRHRYVLVDDVFTTGSTLNSCAWVLRRAGCLRIDVVTFGHG